MSRNVEDRERKKNHHVKVISIGNRPHPHPAQGTTIVRWHVLLVFFFLSVCGCVGGGHG